MIAILALGNFFEIYELFLSGVVATTLKKTFALGGLTLSLVLASGFVGAFFGAIVIGRLADRSGRRRAYVFTLTLYSAFSLLGAFAPTVWALVAFRFFAGIGLGGELPVTDSYLSDVLPTLDRGRYAAWAFTVAYLAVPVVGFLGAGLVDANPLGVAGWRWMFAIGSLGALTTFAVRRRLPESPRWLESAGRHADADAVVRRFETAAADQGWTPPADQTPTSVQIVACGFLLTCAANVMSNAIHIYQSELFPTSIRTTATGWLYSLGRLSIATVPFYLISLLDGYGAGAVFALIRTALLLGVTALAVLGPRTTGPTVEEISLNQARSAPARPHQPTQPTAAAAP